MSGTLCGYFGCLRACRFQDVPGQLNQAPGLGWSDPGSWGLRDCADQASSAHRGAYTAPTCRRVDVGVSCKLTFSQSHEQQPWSANCFVTPLLTAAKSSRRNRPPLRNNCKRYKRFPNSKTVFVSVLIKLNFLDSGTCWWYSLRNPFCLLCKHKEPVFVHQSVSFDSVSFHLNLSAACSLMHFR